ncbi:MAG: AraC family transcriptional regulator ligand-binding domain-containing protein [Moraxellaceae bacterium]|nr:AraC family transcriptional regulator ligand-binding domain-containing protein [Moraxellaceae bacterium]MDZ4386128.1 AraC family transcriptional regulator ligand-binding domain-containing protein [Moraxellaceae bacterium]
MNRSFKNAGRKHSTAKWVVPAVFPQTYLNIAAENGHSPDAVLDGVDLLAGGMWRVHDMDIADYECLLDRLLTLLPDRGIGFEAGWRLPPTAFGSLGQALLSSPTVGDALIQCQRFWHLYGVGLSLSVETDDGYCSITLDILFHVQRRHRQVILECALTCLYRCFVSLSSTLQRDGEMLLDWPEPIYGKKLREHIGAVSFNASRCQYRFPDHLLQEPSALSNSIGYRNAIEQCLHKEAFQGKQALSTAVLVEQKLVLEEGGYPCFDQVARLLHMTPRTLRRRLQQEGTRFGRLLQTTQCRDALRLLERTDLEVQKIALMLGYTEPANFTRAFQQWRGQTPSQYRQARINLT